MGENGSDPTQRSEAPVWDPPRPAAIEYEPPPVASESSDTGLLVAAVVVGAIAALSSAVSGWRAGGNVAYVVGSVLGVLLIPAAVAWLFSRKSRRAALIAFLVCVGIFVMSQVVNRGVEYNATRDQARATQLLEPVGQPTLETVRGECLDEQVAEFDSSTLEQLERTNRPPTPFVAERLRDSVIDCGVQAVFVDQFLDEVEAEGVATDAFDRRCMMLAISEPGVALMHATSNTTMVEVPASVSSDNPLVPYFVAWSPCIDGGVYLRDQLRATDGPRLVYSSVSCLSDWFEVDDRVVRMMVGELPDAEALEMTFCFTEEEYDAWLRGGTT